jgi:DNA-binding CsgD family transcriptional regulator
LSLNDELIGSLIHRIYDAAIDSSLWSSIIREVASIINAHESLMFSPKLSADAPFFAFSPHQYIDMRMWNAYEEYYWQHDTWALEIGKQGLLKNGVIVHGDQLIARNKLRETEIYRDMYKPNMMGIEVVMAACIVNCDRDLGETAPVFLNFFRTGSAEAFNNDEQKLISHLLPHIQRALLIHTKLTNEQQMRNLREQALEQIATAILLMDDRGHVIFANQKAELLLHQGSDLKIRKGNLCCSEARNNNAIKHALVQAKNGIGSALKLNNPQLNEDRVIIFSPLRTVNSDIKNSNAYILVMLADPAKPFYDHLQAFAALYKLTRAETRVLKHLLELQTTQEMAEILHVSMNTLRTQIKALFLKTNTKNQRELTRFCLSHPLIGLSSLKKL